MALVYTPSTTTTTITYTISGWSSIVRKRRFIWYLDGVEYYDSDYVASTSSYSCKFIGLRPSTTYSISVHAFTANDSEIANGTYHWDNWYYLEDVTTDGVSYTLTMSTSSTSSSVKITARISAAQSHDIPLVFCLKESSATTWREVSTYKIAAGSTSQSCTFYTNITPGTIYYCSVVDSYSGLTAPSNANGYLIRRTKNAFAWTGGAKVKGEEFSLLASDWNEFTSQLKSKEIYFTSTDTRTFTTAVTGADFTAVMFNQAVAAINNIVSSGADGCTTTMATVNAGDKITAAIINKLVTCLNE